MLLKAVTDNRIQGRAGEGEDDGWGGLEGAEEREETRGWGREREERRGQGVIGSREQGKLPNFGANLGYLQQQPERAEVEVNYSLAESQRISQVISLNEQIGEQCHPMILSNINNNLPINFDRLSVLRIRNAASELRQTYLDLTDYLDEQRAHFEELKEELQLSFFNYVMRWTSGQGKGNEGELAVLQLRLEGKNGECLRLSKEIGEYKALLDKEQEKNRTLTRSIVSNKRLDEDKSCAKCRGLEGELDRLRQQLYQAEQQVQKLLIENESLQEYIFDIEQKIVGVDLEVEKRLKEKTKTIERPVGSPIRETQEIVEQLEAELAVLQEKCRRYEDQKIIQLDLKEKERQIRESEAALGKKQAIIKENLARIEEMKEANYQRQHEFVVAEENLSKKIADFRKKEAELSEWQAELTRKSRGQRDEPRRDNTLANQFPSNEMSLQNSVEQLNQSGEISLKSFGRNQDDKKRASEQQLDFEPGYKIRTLNYEEEYRPQHEFVRERQNYPRPVRDERPHMLKPEGKKYGESAYTPKSREHAIDMNSKRYNPQMSNYSRQASPYRNLNEPIRSKPYQLPPKISPNHYRELSKNSRSTSKSKVGLVSQVQHRPPPRDAQIGGLGSKLQRLREQIKKEIDSIK